MGKGDDWDCRHYKKLRIYYQILTAKLTVSHFATEDDEYAMQRNDAMLQDALKNGDVTFRIEANADNSNRNSNRNSNSNSNSNKKRSSNKAAVNDTINIEPPVKKQ